MMKNRLFFVAFLLPFSLAFFAQDNLSALMPYPNKVTLSTARCFKVQEKTALAPFDSRLAFAASQLQQVFQSRMDQSLHTGERGSIHLLLDTALQGAEHYNIEVTPKKITLSGATPAAVYYAVLTLEQLMEGDVLNTRAGRIACIGIDDQPLLPIRALMVDPSRHFLPFEHLKFYVNEMSRYKFNTLQLHLSDDQGWRMEILSHPELTQVGAFRKEGGSPNGPHNGFYTQQQLRELVTFAAERGIEVIPEMDIPGHTVALLKSHPELACAHQHPQEWALGKETDKMLCVSVPAYQDLLRDVFTEVAAVFPSSYIHLGGDEAAVAKNWAQCPRCQALMAQKGYTRPAQLMGDFFAPVFSLMEQLHKRPVMWCELNSVNRSANAYLFNYPPSVTLVSWRGGLTPMCIDLSSASGNPLILAPGEHAYLDYPQFRNDLPETNNWGMPTTTLRRTYEFNPLYNLPQEKTRQILGVMGTLWSEAIMDVNRLNYMTYPRAFALAEAGWTRMEVRSWESFVQRLYPQVNELMRRGVAVRVPFEIASPFEK